MIYSDMISGGTGDINDDLVVKATGRYYTSFNVANNLAKDVTNLIDFTAKNEAKIIDPFAGDGRLVVSLINYIFDYYPDIAKNHSWKIYLWDINEDGLEQAKISIQQLTQLGLRIELKIIVGDTFHKALSSDEKYDVVITNPPWEVLKPDSRELTKLSDTDKSSYITSLKEYDDFLCQNYGLSQPKNKFAGWGTNLSRVGIDVCTRLCRKGGVLGVVMPASFMADEQSAAIRTALMSISSIHAISYYPAEAKLYGKADVDSCTITLRYNTYESNIETNLTVYSENLQVRLESKFDIQSKYVKMNSYSAPISFGADSLKILAKLSDTYLPFSDLEGARLDSMWAGREIDETRSAEWLSPANDGPLFVKGKMISRFLTVTTPTDRVDQGVKKIPESSQYERIVWRDVSRASQKRRMIATIIPQGWVAGNSLGVAYFKDGNHHDLLIVLGIISSLVFEFQLRAHLATGHISLSSLRKACLPSRSQFKNYSDLLVSMEKLLKKYDRSLELFVESYVAKNVYNLCRDEFSIILEQFPKITENEKKEILKNYDITPNICMRNSSSDYVIHNHISAKLSELDMRMVKTIPQGGCWKNIPTSIPSKRLEKIREDYKAGKGSRSTYYGRLRAEMPSYTINTYFNRPGNGCHIHYDQDRVISQREAARLQSFPDSFVFSGPQSAVNNQIGNAVPPLLAFQIAQSLGTPGRYIDLFCGAGGLGLGFKWAGWEPVVGNDIEKHFLETYSKNVHNHVVLGSISDPEIFKKIVQIAIEAKRDSIPFWILGGPPCQGFSTAGYRIVDDKRNTLVWDYLKVLEEIKPDGFLFENVTGLLNMEGGTVFESIKNAFCSVAPNVSKWVLNADEYGIPQRRKRVFLLGKKDSSEYIEKPKLITSCDTQPKLFGRLPKTPSVQEALEDLPPLLQGEDGTRLTYKTEPMNHYQRLMRGTCTPHEYLHIIQS